MIKKLLFMVFVLFVGLTLVSAVDTNIKVKTLADHKISVFVYPAGEIISVETYHRDSDNVGNVEFVHSSDDDEIDIRVIVKVDNGDNLNELFEGYEAGEPIHIRLDYDVVDREYSTEPVVEDTPEESVEEVIEEVEEEVEVADESAVSESALTGEVISESDNGEVFSASVYLIVIGIVIVTVVAILLYRRFKLSGSLGGGSQVQEVPKEVSHAVAGGSSLSELQKELRESQREIRKLKREQKAREVEFKIEEEKKELERIRREEED